MRRKVSLMIGLILGAITVINVSQALTQTTGEVKGLLVYENSGEPAAGISLLLPKAVIVNEELKALKFEGRFAETNSLGIFHFVNIPPGKYALVIPSSQGGIEQSLTNEKEEIICGVRAGKVTDFGKFRIKDIKPTVKYFDESGSEISVRETIVGEFRFDNPIRLKNNKKDVSCAQKQEKAQGIRVMAICGRGCDPPMGSCDVFILSESEYWQYLEKGSLSYFEAKGKTPLLITDIETGTYYVGAKIPIDPSVIKIGQPGELRPHSNVCIEFFVDDWPYNIQYLITTSPEPNEELHWYLITEQAVVKWYKVSVEEDIVSPVVALFLNADGSFEDWEKYYPKEEQFQITASKEEQEKFWEALETTAGDVKITPEQRENLMALLKRGGRVCLPNTDSPIVFWINSKGELHVGR